MVVAPAPAPLHDLDGVHHGFICVRRFLPVLLGEHHLRRLLLSEGVEDLLAQDHPVRSSDQCTSSYERLGSFAVQDGVGDAEEVHTSRQRARRQLRARHALGLAVVVLAGGFRRLLSVGLVVNLLELPQEHGRRDDTLQVRLGPLAVERAERGDALEHVLDGGMGREIRERLVLVRDETVLILVLRHAGEVAGGDGEDGVQQVRLCAGSEGDDALEVLPLVREVELRQVSVTSHSLQAMLWPTQWEISPM